MNKIGNLKEITVFDQISERKDGISINEFREIKRKGTNDDENKIKNIDNKTNINEILVEDDNDDATSIDYDGSQKGSVRSSGRNRSNIENKEENNIEDDNEVEVVVEVERSSRKKKTGQFKDVMRRSRSFSFSQKMVNKNSEEKIDYNDSNNINNNVIHSNIMTENINNNNININRSIIFKAPSTIEYSSSLLASTIPEGKLKLRAINSDDRLKWVTWLASAIQAQK